VIRIARGAEPIGLQRSAPRYQAAAAKVFNQHGGVSDALLEMLSKGYNSRATKQALYLAQHEKCAWCERVLKRGEQAHHVVPPLQPSKHKAHALS